MQLRATVAVLLIGASIQAQAATDDETPEPPAPPAVAPVVPVVAVSLTIRTTTILGVDLCLFPANRVEVGAELGSAVVVSEAGVYARYAVIQGSNHVFTLGARAHFGWSLLGEDDQSPTHGFVSVEGGYEYRHDLRLFAIEVGDALFRAGAWHPPGLPGLIAEVRFGHLW